MTQPLSIIEVDARGLRCPVPLLKTKQALRQAKVGDVVEVLSDDAGSAQDIPRWLHSEGFTLLVNECQENHCRFVIRR